MAKKYKMLEMYSASEISNGKYRANYDYLLAQINGITVEISDMFDTEYEYLSNEYKKYSSDMIWAMALDNIVDSLKEMYGMKNIYIFQGIAPQGAFDVYSTYKCISN